MTSVTGVAAPLGAYAALDGVEAAGLPVMERLDREMLTPSRSVRVTLGRHNGDLLASTPAVTLDWQDSQLRFSADLAPDIPAARSLEAMLRRGDRLYASIGFTAARWRHQVRAGRVWRELRAPATLREISITPDPAYRLPALALTA